MTQVTEQELIERSTAPRVTAEALEANIKETYWIYPMDAVIASGGPASESLRPLTICVIVLNNGFTIIGQSACADPANYKKDVGDRLAREDAAKKIWAFMGYALREDLHRSGATTFHERMVLEAKELEDKIGKARAFIGGETYQTLSDEAQQLLCEQTYHMEATLEYLNKRIALY